MPRPKLAGEFPSLAELRRAVVAVRGERCEIVSVQGEIGNLMDLSEPEIHDGPIQAAHIMPAGQGGHLVPENIMLMCRGHHVGYDGYQGRLSIRLLSPETRVYLASQGYMFLDAAGEICGRGLRRFRP